MPFFERLKWNSIFECSDNSHVWYHLKAYMCENMKAMHTSKQSIQEYKNDMCLRPDVQLRKNASNRKLNSWARLTPYMASNKP